MPSQEVIACLEDCDSARLGGERLQILNRILPKEEEVRRIATLLLNQVFVKVRTCVDLSAFVISG